MHNLHVIKSETVRNILERDPEYIHTLIKNAYIMHENDETINPSSFFLRFPDKPKSRIIGLPAALLGKKKIAGIKWIASNPENIKNNKPRATAVMILNDYETGFPLACLDGTLISSTRTAVSAVLAAEAIQQNTGKKIRNIGLVGAGPIMQGILQNLLMHPELSNIDCAQILDLDEVRAQSLATQIKQSYYGVTVKLATDLNSLLSESDLIIFATSALEPYVHDMSSLSHNPIILNISLRDVGVKVVLASNNITDDIAHVLQANTSLHLAYGQTKNTQHINGELGALLQKKFQLDPSKTIIFSPMGLGVLDLVLAQYVYEIAQIEQKFDVVKDFLSVDA